MDQSGFHTLPWGRERRQQRGSTEQRIIDSAHPDQEIRYVSQPGVQPLDQVTTSMDPAFLYPLSPYQHHVMPDPQLQYFGNVAPPFVPQSQTSNTILTKILTHPSIAVHRDTVCQYLRLTPSLWTELYKPEISSSAHNLLTHGLLLKYGRLPDDLWASIHELRDQLDFSQSQQYFVSAVLSMTPHHSMPQTPSAFTENEMFMLGGHGSVPGDLEETSPILVHLSRPAADPGIATTMTTPLSMANLRSKSQSPYRRTKGRAPRGNRYKCPYTNCKHEPFRNAGNFNNHMRSAHFESEYRNRHPSEFLMPDVSPQPSVQGDKTSSAATTSSESPLDQRRLSREFSVGDLSESAGRGRSVTVEESAFQHIGLDEARENTMQASSSRGYPRHPSGTARTGAQSGKSVANPPARDKEEDEASEGDADHEIELSPTQEGPVGFAEFQLMEKRRKGHGRRRG